MGNLASDHILVIITYALAIRKILYLTMSRDIEFTAIIEKEAGGYVSLCPELDIASQGDSVEDAKNNLIEALELFLESASEEEISTRLHNEVFITRVKVSV